MSAGTSERARVDEAADPSGAPAQDDKERRGRLIVEAAVELSSLGRLLQREFVAGNVGAGEADTWLRGAAMRLEELANVIMSAQLDRDDDAASIAERLEGPEITRWRAAQGGAA